jgi:hypothetical protein
MEDCTFEAGLGYTARHCLKKEKGDKCANNFCIPTELVVLQKRKTMTVVY